MYPVSHDYHFRSQTKGQDPRSEIQDTKSRTRYLVQDIYVPDTMCLVRGTRLQGTAVVPGAGANSPVSYTHLTLPTKA